MKATPKKVAPASPGIDPMQIAQAEKMRKQIDLLKLSITETNLRLDVFLGLANHLEPHMAREYQAQLNRLKEQIRVQFSQLYFWKQIQDKQSQDSKASHQLNLVYQELLTRLNRANVYLFKELPVFIGIPLKGIHKFQWQRANFISRLIQDFSIFALDEKAIIPLQLLQDQVQRLKDSAEKFNASIDAKQAAVTAELKKFHEEKLNKKQNLEAEIKVEIKAAHTVLTNINTKMLVSIDAALQADQKIDTQPLELEKTRIIIQAGQKIKNYQAHLNHYIAEAKIIEDELGRMKADLDKLREINIPHLIQQTQGMTEAKATDQFETLVNIATEFFIPTHVLIDHKTNIKFAATSQKPQFNTQFIFYNLLPCRIFTSPPSFSLQNIHNEIIKALTGKPNILHFNLLSIFGDHRLIAEFVMKILYERIRYANTFELHEIITNFNLDDQLKMMGFPSATSEQKAAYAALIKRIGSIEKDNLTEARHLLATELAKLIPQRNAAFLSTEVEPPKSNNAAAQVASAPPTVVAKSKNNQPQKRKNAWTTAPKAMANAAVNAAATSVAVTPVTAASTLSTYEKSVTPEDKKISSTTINSTPVAASSSTSSLISAGVIPAVQSAPPRLEHDSPRAIRVIPPPLNVLKEEWNEEQITMQARIGKLLVTNLNLKSLAITAIDPFKAIWYINLQRMPKTDIDIPPEYELKLSIKEGISLFEKHSIPLCDTKDTSPDIPTIANLILEPLNSNAKSIQKLTKRDPLVFTFIQGKFYVTSDRLEVPPPYTGPKSSLVARSTTPIQRLTIEDFNNKIANNIIHSEVIGLMKEIEKHWQRTYLPPIRRNKTTAEYAATVAAAAAHPSSATIHATIKKTGRK